MDGWYLYTVGTRFLWEDLIRFGSIESSNSLSIDKSRVQTGFCTGFS